MTLPMRIFSSADLAIRRYIRSLADDGVDDALLRGLVGAVHTARGPLLASIAMAELTTIVAYLITRDWLFLTFALGQALVGAARLRCQFEYARCEPTASSRARVLAFDAMFRAWATLYAFLLGLTCYGLATCAAQSATDPLAMGCCSGFTLAFVTRSAGRPRLLLQQILALAVPVVIGLLTQPVVHGPDYVWLVVGLGLTGVVLGQNGYEKLIDVYKTHEENRRMARVDMLTGLLNRFAFTTGLSELLQASQGSSTRWALVMVDLDRFKETNDTLGHSAGDALLVEAALRLRQAAGPGALIARMGGDEFMILARLFEPGSDLARQVADVLCEPYQFGALAAPGSASVGMALFPDHAADGAELMKRADFALYEAKRAGRGCYRLFDASMREKLDDDHRLELDLQTAIREDQFEVWFQPIQNIETGALRGYEALARWRHPTRGLVPPDRFIAAAEQSGAIIALGELILTKACAAAARWDRRLSVAVNLSAAQFRKPERFVASVERATQDHGLQPQRLVLELTESLLLEDTPQTRNAINALADYGVRFSLDDFGTGYSSLSYIQHYPFSSIKVDRRFIANIDSDLVSSAIVASVCAMAERLNMEVVAEGVETKVQQRALKSLGVRWAQGYLFGRPSSTVSGGAPLQLVSSR